MCILSYIVPMPEIVMHPRLQGENLTQTATFTCSATGYNVKYQWTIRSGSFPSKVTSTNTNTLVIPEVRSSDDNTYTCVVSNEGGSVSSNATQLTVCGKYFGILLDGSVDVVSVVQVYQR